MGCVYIVTCLPTGKYYIGKTVKSAKRRWYEHAAGARGDTGGCRYLYNAIRKYGKDSFAVETLSESDDNAALLELEKLWIILLDAQNSSIGMNLTSGGDGAPNPSPQRRKQMRDLMLGNTFRKGLSSWCKGKTLPYVDKLLANYWGKRENADEIKNILRQQAGNRKGKHRHAPATRRCIVCKTEYEWWSDSRCKECNRTRIMLYRAMMKDAGFKWYEF